MTRASSVTLLLALTLVVVLPAFALEKTATVMDDGERSWAAGGTLSVSYYNVCTGWTWTWSGWSPGDRIGTCFELPPGGCGPVQAWLYFPIGAPGGYGFTGSVSLQGVDVNCCPSGAVFASQPFLPGSGWNDVSWGAVETSQEVALVNTFGAGLGNPATVSTDHPAAGPTGPAACGTCFPSTRVSRSFYWGSVGSPVCPGSSLNDTVCDAEFIFDLVVVCTVGVVPESWAAVKQLYR